MISLIITPNFGVARHAPGLVARFALRNAILFLRAKLYA
jgi:hypothetical protein